MDDAKVAKQIAQIREILAESIAGFAKIIDANAARADARFAAIDKRSGNKAVEELSLKLEAVQSFVADLESKIATVGSGGNTAAADAALKTLGHRAERHGSHLLRLETRIQALERSK